MRQKLILLLLTLLTASLPTRAYDFIVDGLCYNLNSDGNTVTVTYQKNANPRYDNLSGSLTIPASVTYEGVTYSVTAIDGRAFSSCTDLTSVVIPNTVISIGSNAFNGCKALTSVDISNSVKSIGGNAFYNCSGLKSVIIPDAVSSIGEQAFYNCSSLTSVNIPSSVTSIGQSAFLYTAIYKAHPSGVFYVDNWACGYIGSLKGAISLLPGTRGICSYAFSGCNGMTRITIPESLTYVGKNAFYNCTGLYSVNVTNLATWCNLDFKLSEWSPLYYAQHLLLNDVEVTELVIPDGVKKIKDNSFYNCRYLTGVSIPSSVTTIGDYAFYNCNALTKVNIPNSVKSIGDYAFYKCYALSNVNFPTSLTTIGDYAFNACSGLTSLVLAKTVKSIGNSAFQGCKGLKSVTWEIENCADFPSSPFKNLSNIKSFTFGDEVKTIPAYLCYGLSGLSSVTIPNSVIIIGDYAFYGCTGLKDLTIGSSAKYLRSLSSSNNNDGNTGTFQDCKNLRTVTNLSLKPQSVDFSTFKGVNLLECELIVPAESIERYEWAYYWCDFGTIRAIETAADNDGDVNSDNSVNAGDVSAVYNVMLGNTTDAGITKNADVNGDGSINAGDVSAVYNIMLNK